jgi:hypothetical protein
MRCHRFFPIMRIWSIGWAPERHSGDGGSIPSIRTNTAANLAAPLCRSHFAPTVHHDIPLRKLIW